MKSKRSKGGQPGNQNARKHGFYRASGPPARVAHSDAKRRRSDAVRLQEPNP